jgi:hypothetical protein
MQSLSNIISKTAMNRVRISKFANKEALKTFEKNFDIAEDVQKITIIVDNNFGLQRIPIIK